MELEAKTAFGTGRGFSASPLESSPVQRTTIPRGGGESEAISAYESREEQAAPSRLFER